MPPNAPGDLGPRLVRWLWRFIRLSYLVVSLIATALIWSQVTILHAPPEPTQRRSPPSPLPTPGPPPIAPRPVPIPPDLKATLEEAFQRLAAAAIAFNAPATMRFEETSLIELLLSLTESIEDLKRQLTAQGERQGFAVRAGAQMEATLRPAKESAFKVVPARPEIQNLRGEERTQWLWRVTPLEWGPQELDLTVSAIYQVDGRDGKRPVRVFAHKIQVDITTWEQGKWFAKNNWQWAWTALLVPVLAWVWALVRSARRRRLASSEYVRPVVGRDGPGAGG